MNNRVQAIAILATTLALSSSASAQAPAGMGTSEFGLTARELVKRVEKVEALIAKCMRAQGFDYVAVDYMTVRRGMSADKKLPGLSEEDFIAKHGYGVSTLYTGTAPQLATGYSPAQVGLGERNVEIYRNLSTADQVAYNRALLGGDSDVTLAVGLERESFYRCGGCTREAIEQVFDPEQLEVTYYNPMDALINDDPRMKAALREYVTRMRQAGFDYSHPDEVETDLRERLDVITDGGSIPVEQMSPERLDALKKLQDYELRVALVDFELAEEIFDPVEERIQKELFARDVK